MLGGSVYVAFIRLIISILGTVLLFTLMDEPRFGRKKTWFLYGSMFIIVLPPSCIWYAVGHESFVRLAPLSLFIIFCLFSLYISSTHLFLTFYKLGFTFYLMAVFVVGGIICSESFFGGNVWADIIVRILLIALLAFFIDKYLRNSIKEFGVYVEDELDWFSLTVLIISLFFGIAFVIRPLDEREMKYRLLQIVMNFFLIGSLQLMVFRLYLHIGKESEYRTENQLMQMNHRLLERQMEFLEESVESGRRIRHDARHHNMVIAEYARRGQTDELLEYLGEYEKNMEEGQATVICENIAVNNILSAYTKKAEREGIRVSLDVHVDRECTVLDIDLVTILSNAYENAIYGCLGAREQEAGRECFIDITVKKKKNKLVICCINTCRVEAEFRNGYPKPEFTGGIGVSSIVKASKGYGGEPDFKNDNGTFVFRLIMNVP